MLYREEYVRFSPLFFGSELVWGFEGEGFIPAAIFSESKFFFGNLGSVLSSAGIVYCIICFRRSLFSTTLRDVRFEPRVVFG